MPDRNWPDAVISPAAREDTPDVARVFRASRNAALPYLPDLHSPEDDILYFRDVALTKYTLMVARDQAPGAVVGFVAFDADYVHHLYVLPEAQGNGLGTRLLACAQEGATRLRLWTFQRNVQAIAFYERRGFQIVRRTDGSGNEEREPDLLMEWRKPVY